MKNELLKDRIINVLTGSAIHIRINNGVTADIDISREDAERITDKIIAVLPKRNTRRKAHWAEQEWDEYYGKSYKCSHCELWVRQGPDRDIVKLTDYCEKCGYEMENPKTIYPPRDSEVGRIWNTNNY